MKFGKTFETHLTIEWRRQYMRYGVRHSIDFLQIPLLS